MKNVVIVLIAGMILLSLAGCGPEPVHHSNNAESNLRYHIEKDDLTKAGVREIEPGVYLKKFVLGNDVIYLRSDKDGNVLSHSEANITIPSGKTTRSISII